MEQEPLQRITLLLYQLGQRMEERELGTLDGRWGASTFLIQGIHLNGLLSRTSIFTTLGALGIRDRVLDELNKTQFRGLSVDAFHFKLDCDFGNDPDLWPRGRNLPIDAERQEFSPDVLSSPQKPLSLSAVRFEDTRIPLITVVAGYVREADTQERRQDSPANDEGVDPSRRSPAEMIELNQILEERIRLLTDELERVKKDHADELRNVKDALLSALQAKAGIFGNEKELRQLITALVEKLKNEGESRQ